jgi:hypothetical protein
LAHCSRGGGLWFPIAKGRSWLDFTVDVDTHVLSYDADVRGLPYGAATLVDKPSGEVKNASRTRTEDLKFARKFTHCKGAALPCKSLLLGSQSETIVLAIGLM